MLSPRIAPVLVLTCLVACQGAPKGPPSSAGTAVVPLSEASCLIFGPQGSERLDGTRRTPFESPAPQAVPLCSANDANSGWSAIAYPDALIVVNASEEQVQRVDDVQWTRAPQAIGMGGILVGTIEDGTIALYNALEGRRLWKEDGRALLAQLGLDELRFVQPLGTDRMLIVAFKQMEVFANPQAVIVDLDRSGGRPVAQNRPLGDALHVLEACAGDGEQLYVAGTTQQVENLGPRQKQMTKTVVVLRHDPARGRNQVVVSARQAPATEVRVRSLAAGWGLLALGLEDGRIEVFDASGEGRFATRWSGREAGVDALVCVDRDHVAFVSGDRVRIQRLP